MIITDFRAITGKVWEIKVMNWEIPASDRENMLAY